MAVPQLAAPAGAMTVRQMSAVMQQQQSPLDQMLEPLRELVNVNKLQAILLKGILDTQKQFLAQLTLLKDTSAEETEVAAASGSVGGEMEEVGLGVKDLFLGALAALTLWSNELDKYIRTVFLAKWIAGIGNIGARVGKIFDAIGDVWSKRLTGQFLKGDSYKTLGRLTGAIRSIADFFGRILKALATPIETMKKIGSTIGKAIGGIMTAVRTLGDPFVRIGKQIREFAKSFGGVFSKIGAFFKTFQSTAGGALSGVVRTLQPLIQGIKKFLPLIKGIASKVLLPLFALFDFISGFIKGFSEKGPDDSRGMLEKIFDGMVQGAVEVIRGIFIIPLDLLKSGLSWLLGKLGFSEAEKLLDSFSFNEMYDKMIAIYKNFFSTEPEEGYFSIVKFIMDSVDGMIKYVKGLLDMNPADALKKLAGDAFDIITAPQKWIYDNAIKPAIDSIIKMFGGDAELPDSGELGDMASKFIKSILRSILPDPNSDNILAKFASKGIPDAVYKYAGIDPKTGEEIPEAPKIEGGGRGDGAAELATRTADTQAAREAAAQPRGSDMNVIDQSKGGDTYNQPNNYYTDEYAYPKNMQWTT